MCLVSDAESTFLQGTQTVVFSSTACVLTTAAVLPITTTHTIWCRTAQVSFTSTVTRTTSGKLSRAHYILSTQLSWQPFLGLALVSEGVFQWLVFPAYHSLHTRVVLRLPISLAYVPRRAAVLFVVTADGVRVRTAPPTVDSLAARVGCDTLSAVLRGVLRTYYTSCSVQWIV